MMGEKEQRDRFARALQEAMAARRVSGRQLAKDLGIDPRRVTAWLKAKRLPSLYEAPALAAELRVKEDLFRNPPEVPPDPPKPYYPIERYLLGGAVASGLEEGRRRLRSRAPSGAGRPARPRAPRPLADGAGHA
jgi:transcriptional regulator with XRE-family HTH domain